MGKDLANPPVNKLVGDSVCSNHEFVVIDRTPPVMFPLWTPLMKTCVPLRIKITIGFPLRSVPLEKVLVDPYPGQH